MKDFLTSLASPYLALPLYAKVGLAILVPLLTVVLGMVLVVHLPADVFVRKPDAGSPSRGRWWLILWVVRNVCGTFLILLGLLLALPLVPGPGAVFLLIGLGLTDFPGKRRLELRLIRLPGILSTVNRLRARFGRPPLVDPHA